MAAASGYNLGNGLSTNAKSYLFVMLADAKGELLAEIEAKIASPAALSEAAQKLLDIAIPDARASAEIGSLIAAHGPMSARTKLWLVDALTNQSAADEIEAALLA